MLSPGDILVGLDVVSLFTNVPRKPMLELLRPLFPAPVVNLFLRSTYFRYEGMFYEQTEGLAMGSPLSLVIMDFCMEAFEETAPSKPKCISGMLTTPFDLVPWDGEINRVCGITEQPSL